MTNSAEHNEDLLSIPSPDLFEPDDLIWDRSSLISAAADMIQGQVGELIGGNLVMERIWLEKMNPTVVKNAHLEEGTLDWVVYLRSPALRVTKAISLSYPVNAGKVAKATYFRTSSGQVIPLTREHLLNFVQFGVR